tara:strand:- start:318 stop:575 length:258 start_codon:yes stop_codon:yes gene_type:complete
MKCKICSKILLGRNDKKFCSIKCKNYYHVNLRKVTDKHVKDLDTILHRNRSILLEVLGKSKGQITVDRVVLEKRNLLLNTIHTYI